jgi:hypothetical protein
MLQTFQSLVSYEDISAQKVLIESIDCRAFVDSAPIFEKKRSTVEMIVSKRNRSFTFNRKGLLSSGLNRVRGLTESAKTKAFNEEDDKEIEMMNGIDGEEVVMHKKMTRSGSLIDRLGTRKTKHGTEIDKDGEASTTKTRRIRVMSEAYEIPESRSVVSPSFVPPQEILQKDVKEG